MGARLSKILAGGGLVLKASCDPVIIIMLVGLIISPFVPHSALGAEVQNVSYDASPPINGMFTEHPESFDSVPFDQVRIMIDCDPLRAECEGRSYLQPSQPQAEAVVCVIEDDDQCFTSVKWYEIEDYIDSMQDGGVLVQEGTRQVLIAASW